MARTANNRLDSKTRRLQLAPRPKPYYQQIARGVTLGYVRRADDAGSWLIRRLTAGRYRYETLGAADDLTQPNGKTILSHAQAVQRAGAAVQGSARLTVKDALERYLDALDARSAHAAWARKRADHIIPTLGGIRVDRLTQEQIEEWRNARVRRDGDDEAKRKSQDTANRLMTVLRAALNAAYANKANNVPSDAAWRDVKQFKKVGRPRTDLLQPPQVRSLISAAAGFDKPLAALIAAGYLTGCRVGELVTLDVRDLDAGARTLHVRKGKTGPRIVILNTEATTLLAKCANDRETKAPLLPATNGEKRWLRCGWVYPFKRAVKLAGLSHSVTFYALRHSHISAAVVASLPLPVLAQNTGTSARMIEQTYFKALAATRRDLIEATSPKLRLVK